MTRRPLAFVALIVLILAGCSSRIVSTNRAAPVKPEQLPKVRTAHVQVNPTVHLALVTDVLQDSRMVSADYSLVGDFAVNDAIVITDSEDHLIANGIVTEVVGAKVTVQYAKGNGRAPSIGDLVMHFQ